MMTDSILKSVYPLVYQDEHRRWVVQGTSIFVRLQKNLFLLTAAHVLRNTPEDQILYVLFNNKAISLTAPAIMTKVVAGQCGTDWDIAFFPLHLQPGLADCFVGQDSISLEEFNGTVEFARHHYLSFGFPYRAAKSFAGSKEIKIKPFRYISNSISEVAVYTKHRKPEQDFLLTKFDPKKSKNQEGEKRKPPMREGISGGPIFKILVGDNDECKMLIFEGVLIEQQEGVFIATKKSKLRELIRPYA